MVLSGGDFTVIAILSSTNVEDRHRCGHGAVWGPRYATVVAAGGAAPAQRLRPHVAFIPASGAGCPRLIETSTWRSRSMGSISKMEVTFNSVLFEWIVSFVSYGGLYFEFFVYEFCWY